MVKYHKQSSGCNDPVQNNCAEIKFEFPQITFTDKLIEAKINETIFDLFSRGLIDSSQQTDFEAVMKMFVEEYERFRKEFPDAHQSWVIERTGKVLLNKANIFSIDCTDYSFTGGAHPNSYVTFKNFNLQNGNEINLNELIKTEKQNELKQVAESEFRNLKNLKPDDDLGQAGFWFENNQFQLNDNFLITDSSLVFYYNNYEITAYAFGPTELVIPFPKLNHLIIEEGPLGNLIKK
jgi:hypothetical protein